MAKRTVPEEEIVRFDIHQVIQHNVIWVTFIPLALTGFPLQFYNLSISQWLIAGVWGGIENTRLIHNVAALVIVLDCLYHLGYIAYTTIILKRPFPVEMIPNPRDFRDLLQELSYNLGLARERPRFDRFCYGGKASYWTIFCGMLIMAGSGFVLMYPGLSIGFLPGWAATTALVAHKRVALLLVIWFFIVHFFFTHFAPGVFPFNTSIFTGKVPRERYRREHPLEYERLSRSAEGEDC